jgi:hypothetical protein
LRHLSDVLGVSLARRRPVAGGSVARQSGWEGGDDQECILTVAAE